MHHTRRQLLSYLALVLLAACSSAGRPSRPGSEERTILEVENRSFTDMTIYLVEGAGRRRLGLATGSTTTKMTIPASAVSSGRELQFLADPIGSDRTARSDRIYVRPGETVTLMIPPS